MFPFYYSLYPSSLLNCWGGEGEGGGVGKGTNMTPLQVSIKRNPTVWTFTFRGNWKLWPLTFQNQQKGNGDESWRQWGPRTRNALWRISSHFIQVDLKKYPHPYLCWKTKFILLILIHFLHQHCRVCSLNTYFGVFQLVSVKMVSFWTASDMVSVSQSKRTNTSHRSLTHLTGIRLETFCCFQ